VKRLSGARMAGLLAVGFTPCLLLAAATKDATPARTPEPTCTACHGANGEGMAAAHVPRLTGQSAEYLQKQLDDYASGARDNPIMRNFAKELSEERRAQLAAQFAAMSAPFLSEASMVTGVQLTRGHKLAYEGDGHLQLQACNSCHGPDGSGVLHAAPYLAGQSAEYIASALKAFQSGKRKNDGGELMRSVAKRLNDADISAVSAYFFQAGAALKASSSQIAGVR
jgi:cytochrome c553